MFHRDGPASPSPPLHVTPEKHTLYLDAHVPREKSIALAITGTEGPLPLLVPGTSPTLTASLRREAGHQRLLQKNPFSWQLYIHIHVVMALNNLEVRNPFIPFALMVGFYIPPQTWSPFQSRNFKFYNRSVGDIVNLMGKFI